MRSPYENVSREEHLAWAKERALEFLDLGEVQEAWSSLVSDLSKHGETKPLVQEVMGKSTARHSEMYTREYIAAL